jgi:hypothetical protein
VSPQSLNIAGSTQPEIFQGTVDGMVQAIRADPTRFWQDSLQADGPMEIWEINGERFLSNGNHRYQAAVAAGADIPDNVITVLDMSGSAVPTFRLDQLDWLPGRK